jgi:predicted phage terminase large subunit-like protein
MYLKVFPGTRISSEKDTELEFMTTKRGFRLATSVGGTLTGRGGNIIIIDDPLKPQDAYSDTAREQLNDWYGRTLLSRLDNKAQDPIIIVMQRLHVGDLVGRLLEQGGWTSLSLPAIAEFEEFIPLRPGWKVHRHPGDLLHPEREPKHVLDEIKNAMGSVDFAAQYQQQPVPPKGHMIDWSWFRFYDKLPILRPRDRVILSWDTAMSANELADYSVCMVLLVRQEAVFVLDVIRQRLDYPNLRRRVIEIYGRWRKVHSNTILVIENLGSGMSLIQDLRAQHIYPIAVHPRGDKVMRMHQQTARIEAGGVSLPLQAHWLDEFKREILSFPHGQYDDQVDALSQGLDRAFNHRSPVVTTGVYVRT